MQWFQLFLTNRTNLKRTLCIQMFMSMGVGVFLYTVYLSSFDDCESASENTHDWINSLPNLTVITYTPDNFIFPLPTQSSSPMLLTIIVCSSAANFASRQAIRQTWGSRKNISKDVEVLFLIGRPADSISDQMVFEEKKDYPDIIHYDFKDTYFNLTLKSVMLLDYVQYLHNNSKYIMKTDDDTFVNVAKLRSYLLTSRKTKQLFGFLLIDAIPERNKCSKWFIPERFYADSKYPNYLSGSAYVMDQEAAVLLQKNIRALSFFPYEDIFVTGFTSTASGLVPQNFEGFTYKKPELTPCVLQRLITGHRFTAKEQFIAWQMLREARDCG